MKLAEIPRFQLASLVALAEDSGTWFVVGCELPTTEAELVRSEIESLIDGTVGFVVLDAPDALSRASREHADAVLVVASPWGKELELDTERSMLARARPAVLLMPVAAAGELSNIAPHFLSWIGGEVHRVVDDRYISADDRAIRLDALRTRFGLSDEQLLEAARAGVAPNDPAVAEWLVLLGASDLLHAS